MEIRKGKHEKIKGWAIDADPRNEPTYPMKQQLDDEVARGKWERPPTQRPAVEVLRSVERPVLSAVVGEATPPSGLSGHIRRLAYRYSENEFSHWIPLLLADRVDECEGIIHDIRHGIFPNLFLEKGGYAAWKYDRAALVKKIALFGLITGAWLAYRALKKRS